MSIPTVEVLVRDVRSPMPTAGLPNSADAVVFVPGNPGASGYAGHLAALLDQLALPRAHIVAHNFAGPWALARAARHPGLAGSHAACG